MTVDRDFERFASRTRPALVLAAGAVLLDAAEAEDVAQEALAAAYADWDRVAGLDRPDLWARRIVVNRAIDLRRRRTRFTGVFGRLVGDARLRADLGDTVAFFDAVARLPRRQQEVVLLRAAGELSVDEVADALGIAPGTVKATLHRARTRLAALLVDDPDPAPTPTREAPDV